MTTPWETLKVDKAVDAVDNAYKGFKSEHSDVRDPKKLWAAFHSSVLKQVNTLLAGSLPQLKIEGAKDPDDTLKVMGTYHGVDGKENYLVVADDHGADGKTHNVFLVDKDKHFIRAQVNSDRRDEQHKFTFDPKKFSDKPELEASKQPPTANHPEAPAPAQPPKPGDKPTAGPPAEVPSPAPSSSPEAPPPAQPPKPGDKPTAGPPAEVPSPAPSPSPEAPAPAPKQKVEAPAEVPPPGKKSDDDPDGVHDLTHPQSEHDRVAARLLAPFGITQIEKKGNHYTVISTADQTRTIQGDQICIEKGASFDLDPIDAQSFKMNNIQNILVKKGIWLPIPSATLTMKPDGKVTLAGAGQEITI